MDLFSPEVAARVGEVGLLVMTVGMAAAAVLGLRDRVRGRPPAGG